MWGGAIRDRQRAWKAGGHAGTTHLLVSAGAELLRLAGHACARTAWCRCCCCSGVLLLLLLLLCWSAPIASGKWPAAARHAQLGARRTACFVWRAAAEQGSGGRGSLCLSPAAAEQEQESGGRGRELRGSGECNRYCVWSKLIAKAPAEQLATARVNTISNRRGRSRGGGPALFVFSFDLLSIQPHQDGVNNSSREQPNKPIFPCPLQHYPSAVAGSSSITTSPKGWWWQQQGSPPATQQQQERPLDAGAPKWQGASLLVCCCLIRALPLMMPHACISLHETLHVVR